MTEKKRIRTHRSPLLPPRKPGVPAVWHPEFVGKIHAYPKTQEAFDKKQAIMRQQIRLYNAEGITGRNGVRDGWAGKKKLINDIVTAADAEAKDIVTKMIDEKVFEPDCKEARLAMEAAVAMVTAQKHTPENEPVPLYPPGEVNKALKTILEFTQRKPVSKSEVAVAKAEDFLAMLVKSDVD